jgi:hypothetical protein
MGALKHFPLLLLCASLSGAQRAALPAENLQELVAPAPTKVIAMPAALTQTFDRLKLTNGQVLKKARLLTFSESVVGVESSGGSVAVPYELFPAELQTALAQVRPVAKVIVKGGYVEPASPLPREAAAAGSQAAPKIFYPGHITVPVAGGKSAPIAGAMVLALRPADFGAYNQARLKQHGAEIDAAADKAQKAIAAAQRDPALGAAARAALTDYQLTIYASFDPMPASALETTSTNPNGSFTLACDEPEIVLLARGTLPVGDDFAFYTWTVPASGTGSKVELNGKNFLTR